MQSEGLWSQHGELGSESGWTWLDIICFVLEPCQPAKAQMRSYLLSACPHEQDRLSWRASMDRMMVLSRCAEIFSTHAGRLEEPECMSGNQTIKTRFVRMPFGKAAIWIFDESMKTFKDSILIMIMTI